MTSGCNETVTDGMVDGLAITLLPSASFAGGGFSEFGESVAALVPALLVEATSILLSSASTSIFSCGAVTGILLLMFVSSCEQREIELNH